MFLKSKKFLLHLPALLLNLIFIIGFLLIFIYTLDTQNDIYKNFLKDSEFYDSIAYGLFVSFITIFTSLFIFLLIYYMLFLLKFTYKKEIKNWLFFLQIPLLIPYSFCAFLIFLMFFPTGFLKDFMPFLVGTTWAVIIAYIYKIVPFLLFISFPTLLKIKNDEIKLHKIYSNNSSHFFFRIVLRRNLKIFFLGIFIVFTYMLNAYEIPSILGSNIDKMPAVLVYERLGEFSLDSVKIAYASSLICFFLSLCFIPIFILIYKLIKKYAF